jgi:hypothetical protein
MSFNKNTDFGRMPERGNMKYMGMSVSRRQFVHN